VVPPAISFGYLILLCIVLFLELDSLPLSIVVAGVGIFLFYNSSFLSSILCLLVLAMAILNLFLLLFRKMREEERAITYSKCFVAIIPIFILIFMLICRIPLYVTSHYTGCQSNLKNLGTAMEMYSTDNGGHYPGELKDLKPKYMRIIPRCVRGIKSDSVAARYYHITNGIFCGNYHYESATNPDLYTMYCSGRNHANVGVDENYPKYNSTVGLIPK